MKPEYKVINVTEGSKLGPIHCTADCYPKCIFNWKYKKSEHFELVHLNPILTVTDIKRNKAGIYRCSVVHPYDITFMRKVDIEVNVQCKYQFIYKSLHYRVLTKINKMILHLT